MARANRKTPRRGRLARIGLLMLANPAASGGGLVMTAMAAAIVTNALALQPGAHPAPLFRDVRPAPPAGPEVGSAAAPGLEADSLDDLVARTTGRQRPAVDSGLVAEIQSELKARGLYPGEVDGLTGPMTSAAILRFEEEAGLPRTGEPTGDVLAALRRGSPQTRSEAPPPTPPPLPPRAPERPIAANGADAPAAVPAVARPGDRPAVQPAVQREETPAPDPRLARVQEALDLLGYGPLSPDGLWTPATRAAIRRFEENRGLAVTGEINEAFLTELVAIGGLAQD